jgi:thymidylate synthase ThyX
MSADHQQHLGQGSAEISPEEYRKMVIESAFTNSNDRVCAIRPSVHPLVAAVLITRFSRADAFDIRDIFWDEFVISSDSGMDTVAKYLMENEGMDSIIAEDKAGKTIRRILDQYGDDSVREQASGHFVVHDASVLFSMQAFRSHPLITGIEASTRYLDWSRKVDGEYRYRVPDVIASSEYATLYVETMENLFDTYSSLMDPLLSHIRAKNPREDDQTERAWLTATRARAYDNLRRLLPLGSLTNFGVHAQYRAISEMIMNLAASNLEESRETAQLITRELHQVNPAFIAVAQSAHADSWVTHQQSTTNTIQDFANVSFRNRTPHLENGVNVTVLTQNYHYQIARAALATYYPGLTEGEYQAAYIKACARNEIEAFLQSLGDARTNRRHKLPDLLNEVTVRVGMNDISIADYKDLNRHRAILRKTQPDLSGQRGFEIPIDIYEAGLTNIYIESQNRTLDAMHVIAPYFPEEAKMLLTHGTKTSFEVSMGLVEAFWIAELRSTASGDPGYRRVAQDLWTSLIHEIPEMKLIKNFVDFKDHPLNRITEAIRADLRSGIIE